MKTSPFVGLSMVPIMFNRVVLPPPLVPKIRMNSPYFISNVTPLNAVTPYTPSR